MLIFLMDNIHADGFDNLPDGWQTSFGTELDACFLFCFKYANVIPKANPGIQRKPRGDPITPPIGPKIQLSRN
jgi:hypothetical protein